MSGDDLVGLPHSLHLDLLSARVTKEAVQACLFEISLNIRPELDVAWLASAVQRAFILSVPTRTYGPQVVHNTKVRAHLQRYNRQTEKLIDVLASMPRDVDLQIARTGANAPFGKDAMKEWSGIKMISPAYQEFEDCVCKLRWLSGFLTKVAEDVDQQSPNWLTKRNLDLNARRGFYLAALFEAAFARRVTINGYPSDARHKHPTAFMQFYIEMVQLAYEKPPTHNVAGVLRKARKLYRLYGALAADAFPPPKCDPLAPE